MNRKLKVLFLFFLIATFPGFLPPSHATEGERKNIPTESSINKRLGIIAGHITHHRDRAAEKLFQETLDICRRHFGKKKIGDLYFGAGATWLEREDKPLVALEYLLRALHIYEEEGVAGQVAFSANLIGALYWHTGKFDKAMKYYLKALKIFRKTTGAEINIATILNNIGMVYARLSNFPCALEHYREALDMRKKIGHPQPIAASYNNLGNLYAKMEQYPKALDYFDRSQRIRIKIKDWRGMVRNLLNIGDIYTTTGRPREGFAKYKEALDISRRNNYRRGIVSGALVVGKHYLNNKNYDAALPLLRESLTLAREVKYYEMLDDARRSLATLYAAKGNFKKAYHYSAQIKNQPLTMEARQQLEDMRLAQDMEKKERDVEQLKKENKIRKLENRVQIIGFTAVFLLLLTIISYKHKYNRLYKNQLVQKEEKQRRLELESQLKLFQARINPHFLFNSLNSIKQLGRKGDTAALEQTVHHLAHMYRQILTANSTMQVPLEKEIHLIAGYLEIEKKMRMNRDKHCLDYVIRVEDGLESFPVLPLTVETLVENAVIHGAVPSREDVVTITICAEKKGKCILIEVTDDGAGFDLQDMKPGFGIYSVQERLKLFYNGKAGFFIHSAPGKGTRIQMELPHA